MRDFASEADFPTSKFLLVEVICQKYLPRGMSTVASALPVDMVVVGVGELCPATGVFEMLAGGELAAATNCDAAFGIVCSLCGKSSGSLPGCGGRLIAGSVIPLTDDVDVATLPSTQTP